MLARIARIAAAAGAGAVVSLPTVASAGQASALPAGCACASRSLPQASHGPRVPVGPVATPGGGAWTARAVSRFVVRLRGGHASALATITLEHGAAYGPYGGICVTLARRQRLPLIPAGSGHFGSWLAIKHGEMSVVATRGDRVPLPSDGVCVTFDHRGILLGISRLPGRYVLQVWAIGAGRRPSVSARL